MKFSIIGILLSLVCLIIAIKINYDMSVDYYLVDGKTRAFFGLTRLDRLYYGAIGFTGLIVSLIGVMRKEKTWIVVSAISISIISMLLTFIDLWKWMI